MLLKVLGLVLAGLAVQYVVNIILFLDINKRIYNHYPGKCNAIPGIDNGSEDLEFVEERGLVFISSGIAYLPSREVNYDGNIFLYDVTKPGKALKLPIEGFEKEIATNFHPHGLSHWLLSDGTIRLFVVVHSKTFKHFVVILDFDEKRSVLKHVKTIKDDKFIRPNDIAASGENEFVLSNDGSAQTILGNVLELLTYSHCNSIVFYDGKTTTYLLENDKPSNGISFSRDFKKLIVSHINQELIGIYDWNNNTKKIKPFVEIPILTAADNFYVEKQNVVWTGAHPVLKDGVAHLGNTQDMTLIAPSQILRIEFSEDWSKWEITEVLADDGRLISASSVAVPVGKELLIGTVQRKLIHCTLEAPLYAYKP